MTTPTRHGVVDQLDDLATTLSGGLADVRHNIDAVGPTVRATLAVTTLPGPVADALVWCAEQLVSLVNGLIVTIEDALKGLAAPVAFYVHANDWQSIRGTASTVTGRLRPEAMPANALWTGSAAAYKAATTPQGTAANRLATIADKTSTALYFSAAAGCALYVALGAIVVKLIAATAAAVVAFGSEVFSWAGALIILEEAGITGGLITAAVAALVAALTARALITLHGEAGDNSAFPGGTWPDPVAASYADATVTDGDADWSLPR